MAELHSPQPPLIDFLRSALDRHSSGVIYRDLAAALRQAITEDVLGTGDVLPGERDLAEAIDVSRTSVRKAIEALVGDGALIRRHGARTAVAGRVEKPLSALTSFSEDMRSRGLEPGMTWISREVGPASPAEIMALHLSVGARVCRLKRLRTGDGYRYALPGFGDVPIAEAVRVLEAGQYAGFYSLEWVKRWDTTLEEPGIVFAHFANYMRTL